MQWSDATIDMPVKRQAITDFIARCIEEVALEGRSGILVSELFNRLDPQHDLPFREHTWSILQKLSSHFTFHRTISSNQNQPITIATSPDVPLSSPRTLKRKRTWSTTLIPVEFQSSPIRGPYSAANGSKQKRSPQKHSEPFNALKADRKKQLNYNDMELEEFEESTRKKIANPKTPTGDYKGKRAELIRLQYDEVIRLHYATIEESVWMIACEEVRLRHLGIMDPFVLISCSVSFDVLELIGKARERGESAAELSKAEVFGGDARKLHYLLDVLIGANLVVKNIVFVKGRRFNMLHLKRFAPMCMADIGNVKGTMEKEIYPKELICVVMAKILRLRRQTTCVLADIARELGIPKRTQENLRNYLLHEAHIDPEFPLEIFMARCNKSVKAASNGRKLWCLRLRHDSSVEEPELSVVQETCKGAIVEIGAVEQIYNCIKRKKKRGATIPEIRDLLGVPSFRLPYKLAQGLIAQYNINVERVLVGKNTMYRMFVPSEEKAIKSDILTVKKEPTKQSPSFDETNLTLATHAQAILHTREVNLNAPSSDDADRDSPQPAITHQPGSMKEAIRDINKIPCRREKRRQFAVELVRKERIISKYQLRHRITEWERRSLDKDLAAECSQEFSAIATRSVQKIIDELLEMDEFKALSIVLPNRMETAHLKAPRIRKCIALKEVEDNADFIEKFLHSLRVEDRNRLRNGIRHKERENFIILSKNSRLSDLGVRAKGKIVHVINLLCHPHKNVRNAISIVRKQSRRLGQYDGVMYRCRKLHLLIWKKLLQTRQSGSICSASVEESCTSDTKSDEMSNTAITAANVKMSRCEEPTPIMATDPEADADQFYSPQSVLDVLSLGEFINLIGLSSLLTDEEEMQVLSLITQDESWNKLDRKVAQKIRNGEVNRLCKLLVVLEELNLIVQMKGSPNDYLLALQNAPGRFDEAISQVASATLSGGFFRTQQHIRITLQSGDTMLSTLPHDSVNVDGKSVSICHTLKTYDDAEKYWNSLQVLSLKSGHLIAPESQATSSTCEVLRPLALRSAMIYSKRSWTSSSSKSIQRRAESRIAHASSTSSTSLEQPAVEGGMVTISSPNQSQAKKRHSNAKYLKNLKKEAIQDATEVELFRKDKKLGLSYVGYISQLVTNGKWETNHQKRDANVVRSEQDDGINLRMPNRPQFQSNQFWQADLDAKLVELYLERASYQWFIDVPVALQAQDEPTAFRNTRLKRSLLGWHTIGRLLKKSKQLCKRRVKELMRIPNNQARYENLRKSVVALKNPKEIFHEEVKVIEQSRLAALHCRALQIVLHDETSYNPKLAASVLSNWTDEEVRVVWRYLWLAGVIKIPRKRRDRIYVKNREYIFRSKIFESKNCSSLYPLQFYLGANEYANFQKETPFGAENGSHTDLESSQFPRDETLSTQNSEMCPAEHEVGPNLVDGHMAIELSYLAMGFSQVSACFIEPPTQNKVETKALGFGAHVSHYFNVASSEYFLNDSWCVTSRFLSSDSSLDDAAAQLQAFSTQQALARPCEGTLVFSEDLESWVLQQLDESAEQGLSFTALKHSLNIQAQKDSLTNISDDVAGWLQTLLDKLITRQVVWCVSAYEEFRYVMARYAAPWLISPEKNSDALNSKSKPNNFLLSQPWLLLDGNINVETTLMLKGRVCNSLLSKPGVTDRRLHHKLRKILSLQQLRNLLDEMITEKLVYGRVVRSQTSSREVMNCDSEKKQRSMFEVAFELHESNEYGMENADIILSEIYQFTSGDLRYVRMDIDQVHYFPSANCVEAFGRIASELLH
uniref:Uncharacterized protein AlNc14C534G12079 n=1 Tax=Albugo laibachii Nc14 TaxID=890382 RepID=F0X0Z1_9STRA|nr:conserved hypothetical protein [Albugo laibachii Nc14]|eukprot:CCA27437.1 conserved hypothetical protein [Albugo laibachii Nc14]